MGPCLLAEIETPLLVAFGAILFGAILIGKVLLWKPALPFEKRDSPMSADDFAFFQTLREATNGDWAINTMVPLENVIAVREKTRKSAKWQDRISGQQLEFVLYDWDSRRAMLAIALTPTRDSDPAESQDDFTQQALAAAAIPILCIDQAEDLDADSLRQSIDSHLERAA